MLAPQVLARKVEQYELITSLAHANIGLNIGHLLHGDAENVTLAAAKLFSGRRVQRLLAAIEESDNKTCPEKYNPKRLNLVEIHVYGTAVRTLFDSDAISNVMFVALCRNFHLPPKATSRRIRMADGRKAHLLREIEDVSILIGEITKRLACLIVTNAPFDLILRDTATKTL